MQVVVVGRDAPRGAAVVEQIEAAGGEARRARHRYASWYHHTGERWIVVSDVYANAFCVDAHEHLRFRPLEEHR